MRIPEFAAEQVNAYKETKSGYLSGTPSTFVFLNARAFIPADVLDKLVSVLEQLLKKPAFQSSPWRKVYQLQRDWLVNDGVAQLEIVLFPAYDGPGASKEPDARHYTLSVFLQHSWSRGKVHAISRSALEPPAIDLAILDSPEQIDTVILVQAIRYAFKIMSTGAMGVETQQILNPSPKSTDEELAAYVRKNVNSAWHPVGTASMLPREDFGVVDNSLKVYGTSNLRVVDASVIPINVGTHPQAMLYGLAHRAVDIISAARATT
ncbi:hypothetical protein VKT23_009567 [Stygiomarasmius scandens]|uniref:Glucose-methanol-choline oxidoreductase C-terminal domain-containing protein n=1 Tax=Marasmiellus scandens TaxID=2682957 RepID=A0ABR1JF34_9AGAR